MQDYHVHTDNSFDSKTSMVEMCAQALTQGITEIAFTDHFNNHLLDIDLGFYNPERFFRDIAYCRAEFPGLRIVAGVEIGEPHRWGRKIRPVLESYPYDVVIGSVHWVGEQNVFNTDYFRGRPARDAYGEYFAEVLRMVEYGGFDILAHLDLPKRIGYEIYKTFSLAEYEESVRAILKACIARRITLEINTKGLRIGVNQLHPTAEALRWYVEMGGKQLTIGSDSHHPSSLGAGIIRASRAALHAGLTHVSQFEQRRIVGTTPLDKNMERDFDSIV